MSVVIFFDIMFIFCFLGKLFINHTWLVLHNLTFYEYIKKKWNKVPGFNLFDMHLGYAIKRLIFYFSRKSYISKTVKEVRLNTSFTGEEIVESRIVVTRN